MKTEVQTALDETMKLLAIHSPTGMTWRAEDYVMNELTALGFQPRRMRKGTVVCTLNEGERPLVLSAHIDTLGLIVRSIEANGRLQFAKLGGPSLNAVETENVTIITRSGKEFTGVIALKNASLHVNGELENTKRDMDTLEVLLDEDTSSKEETEALGIAVGDFICLDPRSKITPNGYIRSRFLDDKLSAGMLLALAKQVADGVIKPSRKITLFFSVYEEVNHGGSTMPEDTEDLLVLDMGCVGDEISCTERQVSICVKDASGPYDFSMTNELIDLCKQNGLDYATDVYPHYGSDAGAALRSGMDVRFALIGAGVYASHGYERSHVQGVENTMALMDAYVQR